MMAGLLDKMQLHAEHSVSKEKQTIFTISVRPTRSDIVHPCDVAEDVAIAYGYNETAKMKLPSLKPQSLNQFSDLIRTEIAMAGNTEVLTWILCSYKENFTMLNQKDKKATAAINGNPRSADFELIHGLVDRMMEVIGTPFVIPGDETGYNIQSSDEPEFLPGRQATVIYKGKQVGTFGIVHPRVHKIPFM